MHPIRVFCAYQVLMSELGPISATATPIPGSSAVGAGSPARALRFLLRTLSRWFDNSIDCVAAARDSMPDRIDWLRVLPFVLAHFACLAVWFVGVSPAALLAALITYLVRMFAITGFYHRYFSHRSFKTSRAGQFIFGLLGSAARSGMVGRAPSVPSREFRS
jgi:stearoyl-CoA desaturase (delta-9 desaturase)